MIIDPIRGGCTIWQGDSVQTIKGTPEECCERIVNYVVDLGDNDIRHQNYFDIKLDEMNIGGFYADYFNLFKIEYTPVKIRKII